MAFIVIYDANVLYPNTLRDLLIRIAQQPHLVRAKWTDDILNEMFRGTAAKAPRHHRGKGGSPARVYEREPCELPGDRASAPDRGARTSGS